MIKFKKVVWANHRDGVGNEIDLLGAFNASIPPTEILLLPGLTTARLYLTDVVSLHPVRSRQTAALAVATAQHISRGTPLLSVTVDA